MTDTTKKRIHQFYGILVSVACVFAGICFIAACMSIYFGGQKAGLSQLYTRQIVAENFAKIAGPVYTCLVLVLGGFALNLLLPVEKPRLKVNKNLPLILARLQDKTDLTCCSHGQKAALTKEQTLRKNWVLCSGILLLGGSVIFLLHACDPGNWGTNSTPSMVVAMEKMVGAMAVPCLVTILAAYQIRKSLTREIDLMRQFSAQFPKKAEKVEPKACCQKPVSIARVAILVIAVLLVVLGACNEGTADILTKAVNICTECVGLG